MKTAENKGFLTFLNALGRSVPLKTPIRFQIANKINGFVHVSYGTALNPVPNKPKLNRSSASRETLHLRFVGMPMAARSINMAIQKLLMWPNNIRQQLLIPNLGRFFSTRVVRWSGGAINLNPKIM
jgi:hypothetical protein